jgi:hypothetical protein
VGSKWPSIYFRYLLPPAANGGAPTTSDPFDGPESIEASGIGKCEFSLDHLFRLGMRWRHRANFVWSDRDRSHPKRSVKGAVLDRFAHVFMGIESDWARSATVRKTFRLSS